MAYYALQLSDGRYEIGECRQVKSKRDKMLPLFVVLSYVAAEIALARLASKTCSPLPEGTAE